MNTDDLCFPPVDPYAEAKAAFADGELQVNPPSGGWVDWPQRYFPGMEWKPHELRRRPTYNGWIEWKGGECPIPHAKAVEWEVQWEVRLRKPTEGAITGAESSAVDAWWWHDDPSDPHEIVAYRLKPATAATGPAFIPTGLRTDKFGRGYVVCQDAAAPIPAAEDRKTAQEYAAALHGDDDPVQDTDRPGIANAAMYRAMTTPKPAKPEPRDEPGLLTVAPMGAHPRGWGL